MRYFGAPVSLLLLAATGANAQFTAAAGSPFAVGSMPRSVAVADFNLDGKADFAAANAGGNSVTVFLSNGAGGFTVPLGSPFAAGTNPQSVATGDFNGDGIPDLVTANSGGNNITILLGNGSGRFNATPGGPIAVGSSPVFVAVGDFNGDGRADIVTANSGDNTITVLLGNGLGGFTEALGSPIPVGSNPQSIAVGDFNKDGNPDIVTANSGDNSVTVLLGNGAGGFTATPGGAVTVGSSPMSLALGDLNGDGKLDIFTANAGDNTVTALLGDGTGGFAPAPASPFPVGSKPDSVALGDFNGDGFPDLATANSGGNTITVLLGNGMGGFTGATGSPFAAGLKPCSLALGDFNGNGVENIAAANGGGNSVTVLLNTLSPITVEFSSLTFYAAAGQAAPSVIPVTVSSPAPGSMYTVSSNKLWLASNPASNPTGASAIVHLSASPALLTAGVYAGTVRYTAPNFLDALIAVTLNVANPSGTLEAAVSSPFTVGAGPQSVAVADFNGDGNPDLVTANNSDNTVTVLLGDGSDGFTPAPGSPFPAGLDPASVAVGDFNGDGIPDIVTANLGGNNVTILLGDGAGGFAAASGSPFAVGSGPESAAVGDFNGDGMADLVTANYNDHNLTVLLGDGAGGFTPAPHSPFAVGSSPRSVAVADFNGDGNPDLAMATAANAVTILLGNGFGGFTITGAAPVGFFPQTVVAADVNGDGKPDLVTANSGSNSVTVLLGNGAGGFSAAPGSPFAVGINPQSVAVADVNGDGRPDLVTANLGDNTVTVLLGNGAGGFTAAAGSPFAAGVNPQSVAAADVNGDGRADIAVADAGGNAVTVLLGVPATTSSVLTTAGGLTVAYGTSVPLTLKVTLPSGGFDAPAGTATFEDTGSVIGVAAQTAAPYTFAITALGAGGHALTALYGGNTASASSVSNTVSITVTQGTQTIAFAALPGQTFGTAPFAVAATASSGLAVAFASTTPSVCTVSVSIVTLVSVGSCTMQASQPGSANYAAAISVNQSFLVTQGTQTIAFAAIPGMAEGTAPFAVMATASSGLAVSLASTIASVCTVSGATVTLVAVGACNIQAMQAGNADYNAALMVSQHFSVTTQSQTIAFAALQNQTYGTPAFIVAATASSMLAVTFASTTAPVCTVSGTVVTLVAAGTCTIKASQAGNASFAAAPSVSQSFTVTPESQTITFSALQNQTFGTAPFPVAATASSGAAVSFASTTPSTCTVAKATVTLVLAGACTIEASQAGNAEFAAATPVDQSFTVTPGSQTITFAALSNKVLGTAPFTVSATASSGGAVVFTSTTSSICTVAGATVTLVLAGTCTVEADQPGNSNYAAAAPVDQSLTVAQGSQTIKFGALSNQPFGTAPITVSATATSGLAVSFTAGNSAVCTVAGSTVTLVGAGSCAIQASQAGNTNYAAATPVSESFTVTPASQTITFGALPSLANGSMPFTVSATASSGLAVSFASTTASVCTVGVATVTLVAAGTCTIQASQAGNTNYAVAVLVIQHFTVTTETQTITFGALSNQLFGATPFPVGATASSNLTVGFASTTAPVCTLSGTTVTVVFAGTCTIVASQAGNASFAAATPVNQSFTVTPGTQTIAFAAPASVAYGSSPFTVGATASSGLTVGFTSPTSSICTVTAAKVTIVSVGTCTIEAAQMGNANYAPAIPVDQSVMVTQASQTITFAVLAGKALGTVPFTVSATASSGLAVVFTSTTSSICTVAAATVTLILAGACTIEADQPGTGNYTAAAPVDQTLMVTPGSQTIKFGALANQPFGTAPITLSAIATSGLTVTFTASSAAVCTVTGSTVTLVSAGLCTIAASQAGNTSYTAAPSVSQHFTVTPGNQTIAFAALSDQPFGTAPFTISATASSGLAVTFTSAALPVCTVAGATVTLVGTGVCTIQAMQAGGADYAAATPVVETFTVYLGAVTIASILNAGSYAAAPLAADGYTAAFGSNFSTIAAQSKTPLPTTLAGAEITIADSNGTVMAASLYYVSPTQINFVVPEGLATGSAAVTIANLSGNTAAFVTTIAPVSPSLFTADSSGNGVAAATAVAYIQGASPKVLSVFNCTGSPAVCTAVPINLGAASTSVYLILFGTGIRGRSSLAGVSVTLGGKALEVAYAAAQSTFPGLDQVNVLLDRSLIGKGLLPLQLTVDGVPANLVNVNIN